MRRGRHISRSASEFSNPPCFQGAGPAPTSDNVRYVQLRPGRFPGRTIRTPVCGGRGDRASLLPQATETVQASLRSLHRTAGQGKPDRSGGVSGRGLQPSLDRRRTGLKSGAELPPKTDLPDGCSGGASGGRSEESDTGGRSAQPDPSDDPVPAPLTRPNGQPPTDADGPPPASPVPSPAGAVPPVSRVADQGPSSHLH